MGSGKLILAEINTWVWMDDLEKKYQKKLTLDQIPENEIDDFVSLGFNAVWLIGVWTRSPLGRKISQENTGLYEDYSHSLPDWKMEDLPGSPYCIKDYCVDPHFGGDDALAVFRKQLQNHGIKLFLDFVPNHVAQDHDWIAHHPDYFIAGDELELLQYPREYFQSSTGIFCKGRDPFFPPWQDVAQLNAFSRGYRMESIHVLEHICEMCDGIRCDMAMLMLNRVFTYTWQTRAGANPETEYWEEVITAIRKTHPDTVFIAEAYWDLEWDLLQLGFDFCYDKRLYDRLLHESAGSIRQHIQADVSFQNHLLRFIENHDENRILSQMLPSQMKAASVLASTLPGGLMLYEGQWEGRKIKNHVLLGRRQVEPANTEVLLFFKKLNSFVRQLPENGQWELCNVNGWYDNQSCQNLIAYHWNLATVHLLIVVNYCPMPSQGRIIIPWSVNNDDNVEFEDLFGIEPFTRQGSELATEGLIVNLAGWGFHILTVQKGKEK